MCCESLDLTICFLLCCKESIGFLRNHLWVLNLKTYILVLVDLGVIRFPYLKINKTCPNNLISLTVRILQKLISKNNIVQRKLWFRARRVLLLNNIERLTWSALTFLRSSGLLMDPLIPALFTCNFGIIAMSEPPKRTRSPQLTNDFRLST